MLTPLKLRRLGEILSQETQGESITIPLSPYIQSALRGEAFAIGSNLRISGEGKIEAVRPSGLRPFPSRLVTRSLVRIVTRCALEGFDIGFSTKEWLGAALRADDFRQEAERARSNSRRGLPSSSDG
jgi:hypothetical protein